MSETVPTGVRELLRSAADRLAGAGAPSAENDAAVLLAHVLGVERGGLTLQPEPGPDRREAFELLVDRRCAGELLQHLTGSAGFRYLDLAVGPGVFVPRPETELVAGWAVGEAARVLAAAGAVEVVDLGTGSGAIALSVATEVPGASVHAVELDPEAFAWAQRNLSGSGVDLREGDLAAAFGDLDGAVDVVVSNPPYIPLEAYDGVAVEVREHEPPLALWSGSDGLDAIRAVERTAARLLRSGGVVGVEHADLHGEAAPAVFAAAGRWREVRDHRDLAGRPRYLTARLAR